jgi:hypothetical protein
MPVLAQSSISPFFEASSARALAAGKGQQQIPPTKTKVLSRLDFLSVWLGHVIRCPFKHEILTGAHLNSWDAYTDVGKQNKAGDARRGEGLMVWLFLLSGM